MLRCRCYYRFLSGRHAYIAGFSWNLIPDAFLRRAAALLLRDVTELPLKISEIFHTKHAVPKLKCDKWLVSKSRHTDWFSFLRVNDAELITDFRNGCPPAVKMLVLASLSSRDTYHTYHAPPGRINMTYKFYTIIVLGRN